MSDSSSRRFDCVVFDWDGTLMDSIVAIAQSIQQAARDLGLPMPSFEQASHVIGLSLHEALAIAIPQARPEQYALLSERYRAHYLARDADLCLFPGILELLAKLRQSGLALAVATGKSRAGLNRALKHASLRGLFVATRCADDGKPKPDPWMLDDLGVELGLEPQRMLMIGDTAHDREMARRAGAGFIGVAYGAHPSEQLGERDCIACVDSIEALYDAIHAAVYGQSQANRDMTVRTQWHPVCATEDLWEGGLGQRFDIPSLGETGFVVRFEGRPYAYVNRCAHVSIELDWQPGQFFDDQAQFLVCSTHGAVYEPNTGLCVGGPCHGRRLIELQVSEQAGKVMVNLDPEWAKK